MKFVHFRWNSSALVIALVAYSVAGCGAESTRVGTEAGHAHPANTHSVSEFLETEPPLRDDLGSLSYRITTRSEQAQRFFDQGLRLAYGFNHLEAQRAFRMAQKLDPSCAMCFWGEALVLGPNINAPMAESAVAPAWQALTSAQALAAHAAPVEQGLIAALAQRYAKDPQSDRKALDAAYADAMGNLVAKFPDDGDVAVLFAESLMDLSPWDYWEERGRVAKGRTPEIVQTLERVLAQNPNHPGAIHFYIHMVEGSDRPERATPYAERLAKLMPGAGHVVHMPGHIYYRLGRYADALAANRAAIASDERYIEASGITGIYPEAYYPHNVHFLLVSAQMGGDAEAALEAANKLLGLVTQGAVSSESWAQPIQAAPLFAYVQFADPEAILKLPEPSKPGAYVQAMRHYVRGVAFAALRRPAEAEEELTALSRLTNAEELQALAASGVPAVDVATIARGVLQARIALASNAADSARQAFREAAEIQEGLHYMEPPFWYYPVRRSLGAMAFRAGDYDGAVRAFRAALETAPNDVWTLSGLAKAAAKQGNAADAEDARKRLRAAGADPDRDPPWDRL